MIKEVRAHVKNSHQYAVASAELLIPAQPEQGICLTWKKPCLYKTAHSWVRAAVGVNALCECLIRPLRPISDREGNKHTTKRKVRKEVKKEMKKEPKNEASEEGDIAPDGPGAGAATEGHGVIAAAAAAVAQPAPEAGSFSKRPRTTWSRAVNAKWTSQLLAPRQQAATAAAACSTEPGPGVPIATTQAATQTSPTPLDAPASQADERCGSHSWLPLKILYLREDRALAERGLAAYSIGDVRGSGAHGICKEAIAVASGERVVLKVSRTNELQAFQQEVAIMPPLRHPNVARLLGVAIRPASAWL